jgi:hypothetical protein
MKSSAVAVAGIVFSLTLATAESAPAGPYVDEMSRCLVRSTSEADRNFLVKWMFAAAAVHPAVRSIASISDAQRDELNKSAAKLLERLITESCKSEMHNALTYEGAGALQASFQVLGQVAARGLFSDPAVARGMADVDGYMDKPKIERLFGAIK